MIGKSSWPPPNGQLATIFSTHFTISHIIQAFYPKAKFCQTIGAPWKGALTLGAEIPPGEFWICSHR
jgi:hypothetical protein